MNTVPLEVVMVVAVKFVNSVIQIENKQLNLKNECDREIVTENRAKPAKAEAEAEVMKVAASHEFG